MKQGDPMEKLKKLIKPEDIRKDQAKEARIEIRVSGEDKASMAAMAKRLGMTKTEYLTRLHRIAIEKLSEDESRDK